MSKSKTKINLKNIIVIFKDWWEYFNIFMFYIAISSNSDHRAVEWVGKVFKSHSWCSKPHPMWPRMLPGMGQLLLLWATCSSVLPPSHQNFFLISYLNLFSFSLKIFPIVLLLSACVKSHSSSFFKASSKYYKAAIRSPQSHLFSSLSNPSFLSLS